MLNVQKDQFKQFGRKMQCFKSLEVYKIFAFLPYHPLPRPFLIHFAVHMLGDWFVPGIVQSSGNRKTNKT